MDETTPAEIRARAEDRLRPVAQRRVKLLAELASTDDELRPLVRLAVRCEVPYSRITALSGLSPVTIRKWTREES